MRVITLLAGAALATTACVKAVDNEPMLDNGYRFNSRFMETLPKMETLRHQVALSQRMLDLTENIKNPGDWGLYRRWQIAVAAHRDELAGTILDGPWKALIDFIAPPKLVNNPTLIEFAWAYDNLLRISPLARKIIHGGVGLPEELREFNHDRSQEFRDLVNDELAVRHFVDSDFVDDAKSLAASGRIVDWHNNPPTPWMVPEESVPHWKTES